MKRSKHFRKDVLIARGIFCIICIGILTLVASTITVILEKIKESETESFVSGSIITQKEQDMQTQIPSEDQYLKASVNVRLRKEPNTECEVITVMRAESSMLLLEEQTDWYKVLYEGKQGFVSAQYVKKEVFEHEVEEETNQVELSNYIIMIDPADESLHFEIAGLLKEELESRGYVAKLTREIKDRNITAKQRATIATKADADITIGIHTSNVEDSSVNGATTIAPSSANESVGTLAKDSQKLSREIIRAYCVQTGMENKGVMIDDTRKEINYASMPVTIISLGYSSNPSDKSNMQDDVYQKKMVQAIADGIDAYFAQ